MTFRRGFQLVGAACHAYVRLRAEQLDPIFPSACIAYTEGAKSREATVATLNIAHFEGSGVSLVNPWDEDVV